MAVLEAVTFAVHLQDTNMVGQTVEQRAGEPSKPPNVH